MKKGLVEQGQHTYVQCENLVVTLWQDVKPIFVHSQMLNKIKSYLSQGRSLPCPQLVVLYNKHLGGVNHSIMRVLLRKIKVSQILQTYDVAITNMFLLCCDYTIFLYNTTKVVQVDLAKALIGNKYKDCYVCYQYCKYISSKVLLYVVPYSLLL